MESATWENEKRLLATTVRDRLIGNRTTIQYKELLNNKIPTFLKNYLQNSVQKYIHTEEPFQFNNSKRFDFENTKIIELKNSLIKAFEEATIFSKEELTEIINRTVSLQFNLLAKPSTTLLKIFFKNKSERIQTEIIQILEGLDDRRVLIKVLIKNIKEFDQYHIVEEDFKKIFSKTFEEVYQDDFIKSFMSDVIAVADFLDMIYGYENKQIDMNLLQLLLKERNLTQYIRAFYGYSEPKIDHTKIALLLRKYLTDKEHVDSDLDDDEIKKFMMVPCSDDHRDYFAEQSSKLYENEIDRSFDQVGQANRATSIIDETKYQKPLGVSDTDKKFPKVTNVWKDPMDMVIDRSLIEKQPDGPLYSLKRLVDEKDRKFFEKKIFNNDIRSYNEFIGKLDGIDNWKEAKRIIDNELFIRSIEPFSKEALRLGDVVFNRYFPKSH